MQWLRDGLGIIQHAEDIEPLAASVADTDDVFMVPAFAGLGASELRVDGGAARNDLLMQMQADLLGVPVVRPRIAESTARGAAGLAGLAVGFWSDQQEFAAQWQAERRFEPRWPADVRLARMQRWRQAVELSKHWTLPA
ncbi:glycerol kinase domain protein [Bordetella holmesii CDC-H629-BH]|nr:glycerol kinase domain protein [Bordetella holmesii CDC-H629-BH]